MENKREEIAADEWQNFFKQLQDQGNFKIKPCNTHIDFDDEKHFIKLELTNEQKMQLDGLMQHIPNITAAGAMAGAYTVSFPKGLPHTLMSLKQGGFGSPIFDGKRIIGSASFNPMLGQAAIYGVFSAISIVTGQFFLTRINKELKKINMKLNDILRFLYGNMRAELLAEVEFIKYACENYDSIMAHEFQRIATISNIQEAKKIALKDIDFLKDDFNNKINETKSKKEFQTLKTFIDLEVRPCEEHLDFALELYLMSSLMEVYYAGNYEKKYIEYLKKDIEEYISDCNRDRLVKYGALIRTYENCWVGAKDKAKHQECIKELEKKIELLPIKYKGLCDRLYRILDVSTLTIQKAEYYYLKEENKDYNVYYKISDSCKAVR